MLGKFKITGPVAAAGRHRVPPMERIEPDYMRGLSRARKRLMPHTLRRIGKTAAREVCQGRRDSGGQGG